MNEKEKLIKNALAWLDKAEPDWYLAEPIDREAFIAEVLAKATNIKESK